MAVAEKAGNPKAAPTPPEIDKKSVQEPTQADARMPDDQAAAAAVIDAEKADAVAQAAESAVADAAMLPTDAPLTTIGEMAQAPAPAPAASEPAPAATTTPPPAAEQPGQVSPWIIGGAGLVGVGIIAAIADDDDDGPSAPPVAEVPPPAPPEEPPPEEEPPANTAPTSPATQPVLLDYDRSTALSAENFPFDDADEGDALTSVRITGITPAAPDPAVNFWIDPATNHGYQLVAATNTWEEARDAAAARGGYLAKLDTEIEMQAIADNFILSTNADGSGGTWIGASQEADSASPDVGWKWLDGSDLPADSTSPLWNNLGEFNEPNDAESDQGENNAENYAAIFDGVGTNLIYDAGSGNTETQSFYLIEYNPDLAAPLTLDGNPVAEGDVIAADQLGNLSWNSVFNNGGTLTFQVADASGAYSEENTLTFETPPPLGIAPPSMIALEDQHLNVLA